VLVLGEAHNMSGENASRSSLSLPGRQEELLEAAVATGKPIVLVLLDGRPLDISWAAGHVAAILDAWYPGTEGGNAIANLLFGDANPGGKLPFTWPRNVGQVPIYYARNLTQNPDDDASRYWDGPNTPLYRFGYGLSYASFRVGPVKLDAISMRADGTVHATVSIENTSKIAGDEVIQMYTHQRAGSASRPSRELKGFVRVHLQAGETRSVTLSLPAQELGFWSPATHQFAIEPGVFDLWIGTDSAASDHVRFTVSP
jgi:beta-glucosidase